MNMQCVICGAEITKRSSLAYTTKDGKVGRACRTHSEVTQATQSRLEAEEAVKAREKEILEKKKERQRHRYDIPTGPTCWHCHKSGVTTQQHYLRLMIANEKLAQSGKSILDTSALKDAYGNIPPVLVYIKVHEDHQIVKQSEMGYEMHNMSGGHMLVCGDCAAKFRLLDLWEKTLAPEIKPETVVAMMAVAQNSEVTKIAKEIATMELASEKETSTIR